MILPLRSLLAWTSRSRRMEGELHTITSVITALVMALALTVPVGAQEEEFVQIHFELRTSGEFASDTTFFALYGLP